MFLFAEEDHRSGRWDNKEGKEALQKKQARRPETRRLHRERCGRGLKGGCPTKEKGAGSAQERLKKTGFYHLK